MKPAATAREKGIALIMTLAIMAMIIVMLLAFATTIRVEKKIARATGDDVRAKLFTDAGTASALNQLIAYSTNGAYITYYACPNWTDPLNRSPILYISNTILGGAAIPLISPGTLTNDSPPNLNSYQIIAHSNQLALAFNMPWVYVTNSSGVVNGRYAFWIDDESMKMNIKAGGVTLATYGSSEQEMCISNLPYFGPNEGTNVVNGRSGGLETLNTLREFGVSNQDQFNQIKFYSTIYSLDSGSNYMGLTPTNVNSFSNMTVVQITNALSSLCPAVAQKYSSEEWMQFAANLREWINPGIVPKDDGISVSSAGLPIPLIGRNRAPLINEATFSFSVLRSQNGGGPNQNVDVTNIVQVELFNLYSTNYTLPPTARLIITNLPQTVYNNTTNFAADPFHNVTNTWNMVVPISGFVSAYSAKTFALTNVASRPTPESTNGNTGAYIVAPGGIAKLYFTTNSDTVGLIDVAYVNVPAQQVGSLVAPVLPPMAGTQGTNSSVNFAIVSPGDPKIIKSTNMWTAVVQTTNAFNPTYQPDQAPSSSYKGDSNSTTRLASDGGFFFRNGPMQSIAEIGQIPIQALTTTNMWRTIKLYGDGNSTNLNLSNQDYVLLDFLTVGSAPRAKVNVNTTKEYMTGSNGVLTTLFTGASIPTNAYGTNGCFIALPFPQAFLFASNIVQQAQVNGPYKSISQFIFTNQNLFSTASMSGASIQETDWRREGPLRSIANALTTHGEQFSIYSIGQSLQNVQIRGVTNVVLGTSISQTVVERPGVATGAAYRIIYQKWY